MNLLACNFIEDSFGSFKQTQQVYTSVLIIFYSFISNLVFSSHQSNGIVKKNKAHSDIFLLTN